jgi:hypothetical protein
MRRAAGLMALAGLLAAARATTGRAANIDEQPAAPPGDVGGVALEVVGACPDAAAVRSILQGLLTADEARGAPIAIWDQGPHYRIAVREAATTLDDPGRDCAARARQAAVVVADDLRSHPLVLGPPIWTIEKGAVFDVAPAKAGTPWAPGAEFRGALGSGRWSLVGAAGARGPATLTFDSNGGGVWKAELLRFPLDLGARVTWYLGRFRPWLVVGGSLTPTAILGQDLIETDRQWRLDVGALFMAGATLRLFGRIGVAAAINVRWQPRPYHLEVVPHGVVGDTPALWLGLSLSYTIDGKPSRP